MGKMARSWSGLIVAATVVGASLGQQPRAPVQFGTPRVVEPDPVPVYPRPPGEGPLISPRPPGEGPGVRENRQVPPLPSQPPGWSPPSVKPGEEAFPISLPAALKLAHARAFDISIAENRLQIAVAQHDGAKVLWIPSLIAGSAYAHHDGPIQSNDGTVADSDRSSLFLGGAPLAYYNLTDAIFTPLARQQDARAQEANVQAVTNDTIANVAVAYFDAQEARADLAAVEEVARMVDALVKKTETLAPAFAPEIELARVRALQKNVQQSRILARMQWRLVSAELARVLRLRPTVVVQPLEPPDVRMTLIPPLTAPEEMIPLALRLRPELTQYQAQVAAAQERLRQERYRPFLPLIAIRGGSTPTAYPLGMGAFGGGPGDNIGNMTARVDWDLEAIWELKNLGFGNAALIRERRAAVDLARDQDFRFRDYVAKEVTQASIRLRAADERIVEAKGELDQAWLSATKNLEALGEMKRPGGNLVLLVVRPQEAVAAMQALVQSYFNYYAASTEYNRAQYRLYRALGNPAQQLLDHCPSPSSGAGREGSLPITVP